MKITNVLVVKLVDTKDLKTQYVLEGTDRLKQAIKANLLGPL